MKGIPCDYGCGQEAKIRFNNGKWCCNKNHSMCPNVKKKSLKNRLGKTPWNKGLTKDTDERMMKNSKSNIGAWRSENSGFKTVEFTKKRSIANTGRRNPMYGKKHPNRLNISNINKKYLLFSKIEEMRYNPDKPGEKEIQVHCKNHNCPNSKEQGGWFTPTRIQLSERIRQLESEDGNGGSYFYCSDKCKETCVLFNLKSDPFQNTENPYTESEYQTFRKFVLERDNYTCQYCGEEATHVHHEKPQKLEPFFSVDPDYAWSCCEKCHYEKGHKDECSTGNLSKRRCER